MFTWQEGEDIEITLERDGKPIEIKTKLTKAFATSKGLIEDETATKAKFDLRNVWLLHNY